MASILGKILGKISEKIQIRNYHTGKKIKFDLLTIF